MQIVFEARPATKLRETAKNEELPAKVKSEAIDVKRLNRTGNRASFQRLERLSCVTRVEPRKETGNKANRLLTDVYHLDMKRKQ